MKCSSSGRTIRYSPARRRRHPLLHELAAAIDLGVGLRDDELLSSSAVRKMISSVTLPCATLRYGVSMKPNSLVRAYVDSDEMRPMFGPSGVSIGQMRP
jgi:hypothetical protein